MKSLKRIAGINLLVILVYSVLIRIMSMGGGHNEEGLAVMILSAFAVGIHVITCLIASGVSYSDKKKEVGKAWLLSAGIVLLVGFSTCLGNAAL